MSTVTLSDTFEVLVPEDARQALHLKAGDKLALVTHSDRLELVPVASSTVPPTVRQYRGVLRGMTPDIERDQRDRV